MSLGSADDFLKQIRMVWRDFRHARNAGRNKKTTDGRDFYFDSNQENASSLLYGTFMARRMDPKHHEHVDGGTSRYDRLVRFTGYLRKLRRWQHNPFLLYSALVSAVAAVGTQLGAAIWPPSRSHSISPVGANSKIIYSFLTDSRDVFPDVQFQDVIRNANNTFGILRWVS
jgi:hypothetical protein